jgi:hypothetical protein
MCDIRDNERRRDRNGERERTVMEHKDEANNVCTDVRREKRA